MQQENFFNKNNPPNELRQALGNLANNGNPLELILWLKNNGIKTSPYEISFIDKKTLTHIVEGGMERIENDLNYKESLSRWKLLKETGLLTPEIIENGINNYMKVYMLRSPEAIKTVEKNTGTKLNYYSDNFISEFKKDLAEQIKELVGLEVNI